MLKGLLSALSGIVGIVSTILHWWRERDMIERGKQEAAIEAMKKVEDHAKKADRAVAVDDPERTERLRNRFDRSRGGE
jgi:D-lyxose ketol-isomerase